MSSALSDRLSTGIDGLDEILHGGFIPERSYMLRNEATVEDFVQSVDTSRQSVGQCR